MGVSCKCMYTRYIAALGVQAHLAFVGALHLRSRQDLDAAHPRSGSCNNFIVLRMVLYMTAVAGVHGANGPEKCWRVSAFLTIIIRARRGLKL